MAAVKYPPVGERGVGLSRAQGYGLSFEKYRDWLDQESIVIAIIEHIDAMEHLADILAVPGIDATMIGPMDLSGSMGHPGKYEREDVKAVIQRYQEVCALSRKSSGFHVIPPDAALVNQKLAEGFRFVAFSVDTLWLARKCEQELDLVKERGL